MELSQQTPEGRTSVWVTEKWFERMRAEGQISVPIPVEPIVGTSTPQTAAPNEPATTELRTEIPVEDAVSTFLTAVKQRVHQNWPIIAPQIPTALPSCSPEVLTFVQGNRMEFYLLHAMIVIELRDARIAYPRFLTNQLDEIAAETLAINADEHAKLVVAIVGKFFDDYDETVGDNYDPLFGIAFALAKFCEANLSEPLQEATRTELAQSMLPIVKALKGGWWVEFAKKNKLEMGS